jgi:hypothetical protein
MLPLTITAEEIDEGVSRLAEALKHSELQTTGVMFSQGGAREEHDGQA